MIKKIFFLLNIMEYNGQIKAIDEKLVTFKAHKGQNLSEVLSEIFMQQNQSMENFLDAIILKNNLIIHRMPWNKFIKFIKKKWNISIKNKNNSWQLKNKSSYWCNYYLNLLNYHNQNTTNHINQSFTQQLSSDNNQWIEIENNIKNISSQYFINKNNGIIGVYTTKNNHKIINSLIKKIKEQNNFFFTITIDIWILRNDNKNIDNPIHINNDLLNYIEKYIAGQQSKKFKFLYGNRAMELESLQQHKLCTLNNIPVTFHNQTEFIKKTNDVQQEVNKFAKISKNVIITEKVYEGINIYVHPLLTNNKIMVYFLPVIINKFKTNTFYNKSLSSTLFLKPSEVFILGGFYSDSYININKHYSWFNKIPLIKYFFKTNNKQKIRESMIITIKIDVNF